MFYINTLTNPVSICENVENLIEFDFHETIDQHNPKKKAPDISNIGLKVPDTNPLIAEIGDITRFKTFKHLSSFVGLVPRSHQSGDKDPNCSLTCRSNKYLRSVLVEAAWVAIRNDPALLQCYKERIVKSKPPYVIIKVAHKLLNRIRNVWINEVNYQTCIVN